MTRLSGRVPETGTAISGATVAIIDTQGTDDTTQWSIVASDTTDANGEWSVSGLEPSAVERYHAVAQFDSGVEFVNFESLPYLSTPADAFAPTTPVNVGTPTAEVGFPAFFDVTITNTNTPVVEGDILTVDFSANNTGTFQDTQDIRLEIDNVEEDRDNNVTLDGGVSTTGTLQWDTTNETPAQYTATVLSNDDADSVTVQVERAIPDSGVLRYLYEDTASSTTAIDEFNNNDGSITGATFVTASPLEGSASLNLDGSDETVDTTVTAATDSSYSIAALINPDDIGNSDEAIIGNTDGSGNLRSLNTFSSGSSIGLAVRNDSSNFFSAGEATSNLSNGTTYHVVGVYDASVTEIRFYRDGDLKDTTAVSGSFTNSANNNWFIGTRDGSTNPFDGVVDQTDIYDEALSDAEVSNLNNTGSING